MKIYTFLSVLSLVLFSFLICGFQTTIWPQFFPWIPAPLLWINLVVYLAIERKPFTALSLIYLVGFINCAFSALLLGQMLLSLFVLFWSLYFVRTRIYWPGSMYFAVMCLLGVSAFQVTYLAISFLTEEQSAGIMFFDRLAQVFLTPALSFVVFSTMKKLDRMFQISNPFLEEVER